MKQNKITKTDRQLLVDGPSAEDLKAFLCNLLNLEIEAGAIESAVRSNWSAVCKELSTRPNIDSLENKSGEVFRTAVSHFVEELDPGVRDRITKFIDRYRTLIPVPLNHQRQSSNHFWAWVALLKLRLAKVWELPDTRSKQHGVFWLLQTPGPRTWDDLYIPDPTGFESALLQFLAAGDLAKICENPECKHPYFFALRMTQRYCSIECGKPSLRESKRKWWSANRGSNQRPSTRSKKQPKNRQK